MTRRRAAATSVAALVIGTGSQLVANVLAVVLATLWLPLDERGTMVAIMAIASLSATLASPGPGNAYRALRPRESGPPGALTASYLVVGAGASLIAATVALLIQVLLVHRGSAHLGTGEALIATGLTTVVLVWASLLADLRLAEGRYGPAGRWAAGGAAAGLGTLTAAHLLGVGSGAGLVLGQAVGAAVALFASVLAARAGGLVGALRPARCGTRQILISAAGLTALPVSIAVLARVDRVVLEATAAPAVLAIYALAATYVETLRIVPTAIGQLASRMVATGASLRVVLRLCAAAVVAALGCGVLACAAAAVLTVPLFGMPYRAATGWAVALLPAEVGYAVVAVINFVLIGGHRMRVATRMGVIAALVGVLAYVIGAHAGGPVGLIIARDVVFCGFALAAVTVAIRVHRRHPAGLVVAGH